LRGRIEGARGVDRRDEFVARRASRINACAPAGGHRRSCGATALVCALFVASASARNSAALMFVYEFAEAALHEGGHLHAALAACS
jgi:hypothetical protein